MAVFESGAKSSEQKPRYDLIPIEALSREARRMAEGAAAHGENNYRVGKNDPGFITDRINHLLEHALKYAAGDRSDDHLAAIRCNTGMLMWIEAHRGPSGSAKTPVVLADVPATLPECVEVGPNAWVKKGR